MPRAPRIEFENALYHVTARGVEGGFIVLDNHDRTRWTGCLKQAVGRFGLELYAFVLMDNHFHLFLSTPGANLGKAMQYVNGAYAMGFNARHKRTGRLFERRYHGVLVEDEGHYIEVSRYIHLNPVRAGIVKRPEDYIWSSYPGYHHGRKTLPWLNYTCVLEEFGERKMAYRRYREFIAEGIGKKLKPPRHNAISGWLLGSRRFAAKIYGMLFSDRNDNRWNSRAALDDYPLNTTLDEIAAAACKTFDIHKEILKSGGLRSTGPRRAFVLVARDRAGLPTRSIASYLSIATDGGISHIARRARNHLRQNTEFRKYIRRIESHIQRSSGKGISPPG